MKIYGPTIRFIRLEKKISKKSLYRHLIRKETASLFEQGKEMLSLVKFMTVLERLSVTYEEFIYIHNGYQQEHRSSLIDSIQTAYQQKNFVSLEKIYHEQISSHNKETKFYAYIANLLYQELMKQPIEKSQETSEMFFLKTYLLDRQKWFWAEIDLFLLYFPLLETEINKRLMNQCFRSISQYRFFPNFSIKMNQLLTHYVLYCYQKNLIDEGDKWLNTMLDFSIPEFEVVESFYRKFCLTIQLLAHHKLDAAADQFQKIIVLLEILELKTLKKELQQRYKIFYGQFKKH